MLKSTTFKAAPKRADLLEYIVNKDLAHDPINAEEIGMDLVRGYVPGVHDDPRVTASNLRKTLTKYYAEEGRDELVIIGLPPGPGYKPQYSYNPAADALQYYRVALRFMNSLNPKSVAESAKLHFTAIRAFPSFCPSYSAIVDARLHLHLMLRLLSFSPALVISCVANNIPDPEVFFLYGEPLESDDIFDLYETPAETGIILDPQYWHSYYMLATIRAWQWRWNEAKELFAKAIELDPVSSLNSIWYPAFLVANRNIDEAIRIARACTRQYPEDSLAILSLALFLHVAEQFEDSNAAIEKYHLSRDLATFAPYPIWPLRLLMLLNAVELGRYDEAKRFLNIPKQYTFCDFQGPLQIAGIRTLVIAKTQGLEEAQKCLADIEATKDPMLSEQLAIAYMAVGDHQKAIEALSNTLDNHNPLLLWLHVWPIFKPLREYKEFQELVKRIGIA